MAEMSTTYISTLPTGSAGGSKYLVQDDGNNTTKVTVNDAVASATAITSANSSISSINAKIGSVTLPTTAQTLTGAIAEHESDITALNGNLTWQSVTLTAGSDVTINSQAAYKRDNLLFVFASITLSSNVSAYTTLLTHGLNARCGWIAPLYSNAKIPVTTTGIYGDAGNTTIRASQPITAGTYQVSCVIPWY